MRKVAIVAMLVSLIVSHLAYATPTPTATPRQAGCAAAVQTVRDAVLLSDGSEKEESLYKSALVQCPQMAEARYNLGVLYAHKKQFDLAIPELREAVTLRGDDLNYLKALAQTLFESGALTEARGIYEKILLRNAKHGDALLGLGVLFLQDKNYERAEEYLRSAHRIMPNDERAIINLALLLQKRNKLEEARAIYESAPSTIKSSTQVLYRHALLLKEMNLSAEAARALEEGLSADPRNSEMLRAFAAVLYDAGDFDRAEVTYRKLLAEVRGDSDALVTLGFTLIAKNQPSQSVDLFKEALQKTPKDILALEGLGRAYIELGKYKDAESQLLLAVEFQRAQEGVLSERMKKLLTLLYRRMGMPEKAAAYEPGE
jgi:tetratricopeptide (TPR) repeat protein